MTETGRKHMVTTGRFRKSEFYRPLSGDEFEERTVATRPNAAGRYLRGSKAGIQVEQSLGAPTHGQQVGLFGLLRYILADCECLITLLMFDGENGV